MYHLWYTIKEDTEDAALRTGAGKAEDGRGYEMKKVDQHIGSSLEDFLREEGMLEEARARAIQETVAFQVQQAMVEEKITKVEMARRMKTSRAALDRFQVPGSGSATLQTLTRAEYARVSGQRRLIVETCQYSAPKARGKEIRWIARLQRAA